MDKNYIKFYIDEDERPTVKIRKNGKSTTIKRKSSISEILKICKKYGYEITDECILTDNVLLIAHDYEEYKRIEKRKKIEVYEDVKPNMKVSRKNPLKGKVILVGTIAVLAAGIIRLNGRAEEPEKLVTTTTSYSTETTTEETTTEENSFMEPTFKFEPTTTEEKKQDIGYDLQEGEDIVEQIETDSGTLNIIGDESVNQVEETIDDKNDLTAMFTPTEFHYEYPDKGDQDAWDRVMQYDDIFEKYARDYGLDKGLLEARSAQETNGKHFENLEGHPAIGLMQLERVNFGYFADGTPKSVSAYNFTTGEWDKIDLSDESIAYDVEKNIQIATMFSQESLRNNNYNILVGTQGYNMGCGNMDKLMSTCSSIENIDENELRNNIENQEWLNYRESVGAGDPKYIEHNFRYLPNGYTIKVRRVDNGEYETLTVFNDYQMDLQK